ncbi:MAG: hypothetical protein ACI4J7_08750 [Ruminiclostridium sp.]
MVNINSHFNSAQLNILNSIGIKLYDNKDYTDEELMSIHEKVVEEYLIRGFDKNSEPLPLARQFEQIIDIFFDDFGI